MTEALLIVGGLIVAAIAFRNRGRTAPPRTAKGTGTGMAKTPGSGAARSEPRAGPAPKGLAGVKAAWKAQMAAIHRATGIIVFVLVIYFAIIFIREFL